MNQCEEEDKDKIYLAYTSDPANNPFDRIRIYCTDVDNDDILIPQSIIEFFYEDAGHDERLAASKALTYLMMQIAKMGDEKVGGIYLKNSERIKNMRLVLDDLKADLLKNGVGGVYAGGVSRADMMLRRWSPDSPRKPVTIGDSLRLGEGSACVGVVGSGYLYDYPEDVPDGCLLVGW